MRRSIKYIAVGLWIAIASPSCTNDIYTADHNSEDATIVLTLQMPYSASSRTITDDQEEQIDKVDILALTKLSDGGSEYWAFNYMATEVNREITGNTMTVTAKVREMTTAQQFVILANSSAALTAAAPVLHEKIEAIEERLVCTTGNGEWPIAPFTPFPMYARTDAQVVSATANSIGTYPMIRMMARIDVTLNSAVNNFVLTDACLFNYQTAGYISYDLSEFDKPSEAVTIPAIPALYANMGDPILKPTVHYPAVVSLTHPRGAIEQSIYTFESGAIVSEAEMTKKTALVIGGCYNGSSTPTYYRVDLKTTDDASDNISSGILRNHRYAVVVQSVSGPGYDKDIDAYLGSSRLTAEIVPWNEIAQRTIADGQYFLTVDKDELSFEFAGEQINIHAETNYDIFDRGFPVGIQVGEIEYADGSGWLSISNVSGANDDLKRTIGIIAEANNSGAKREAKLYVKAGNMSKAIFMSQEGPYLRVTDMANDPIDALLFPSKESLIDTDPEPQQFKVVWAPTTESVNVTKSDGTNAFTWQGTSSSLTSLSAGSSPFTYTINPKGFTAAEIVADPFMEKTTTLNFATSYATASIELKQIHYNLVPENVKSSYILNAGAYSFIVKSNTAWRIKDIVQTYTSSPDGITNVLNNSTANNLKVGATGGNDTSTGDVVSFRLIYDESGYVGKITVIFESPDGLFNDVTVVLKVKGNIWARSNVVYDVDNDRLTFAVDRDDNAKIPANSQGVFFKWGSLVAVSPAVLPGSTSAIYSKGKYPAGHILFSPTGIYNYAWNTSGGTNNVPYLDDITTPPFHDGDFLSDDFIDYNGGTGYNASTGKGDVCRYISSQPGWPEEKGKWRLPSAQDLDGLYDGRGSVAYGLADWPTSSTSIAIAPEGTTDGRDHAYGFFQPKTGRILGANRIPTATDNPKDPDYGVYFPACGYRSSNGSAQNVEFYGTYWTGTTYNVNTIGDGWIMNVQSDGPQRMFRIRTYGAAVRCVRDLPDEP